MNDEKKITVNLISLKIYTCLEKVVSIKNTRKNSHHKILNWSFCQFINGKPVCMSSGFPLVSMGVLVHIKHLFRCNNSISTSNDNKTLATGFLVSKKYLSVFHYKLVIFLTNRLLL